MNHPQEKGIIEESFVEVVEKWVDEAGAIPDNTCPDIDDGIKKIEKYIKEIEWLEKNCGDYETGADLKRDIPSTWDLSRVNDIFEDLRKDNMALRDLGKYWYQRSQELAEIADEAISSSNKALIEGILELPRHVTFKNIEPTDIPEGEADYRLSYPENITQQHISVEDIIKYAKDKGITIN